MIIKLTDKEAREVCAGLFVLKFDSELRIDDWKKRQETFGIDLSDAIKAEMQWHEYVNGIYESVKDKIFKAKHSTFKIGL